MEWPDQVFQRYSVDIHVPDWDPALLSRFDAEDYVSTIAQAGQRALVHYANSHVGLCLWQTDVGQRHRAMGDRDFLREVIAACRRHGVHPIAYLSAVSDNWAYEHHPEWRISPAEGNSRPLQGRYGSVCPNSPYRTYLADCVREIAAGYDVDGFFFDIMFWPGLCYCPHCTARFQREHGAEVPRVVDWRDPLWLLRFSE